MFKMSNDKAKLKSINTFANINNVAQKLHNKLMRNKYVGYTKRR